MLEVHTLTGSEGSTPGADKEDPQRAVKSALQITHNGGVAGGGKKNSPSVGLSVVLYRLAMWKWGAGKNALKNKEKKAVPLWLMWCVCFS